MHRSGSVSLFPFLAVLICTMGALIVLLVGVSRKSRIETSQSLKLQISGEAEQPLAENDEQAAARRWRQEQLEQARAKTTAQLTDDRARLANAEDQLRRLRDRIGDLQTAGENLKKSQLSAGLERDKGQAEIERLRELVAEAERDLEASRRAVANRPQVYAVVPYDGPSGTSRRPIYIECREKCVILQPEGIVLTGEDLIHPDWPGNPLAAALRAGSDYLILRGGPQTTVGHPYPLLLVRPKGAAAYHLARAAMQGWKAEYGYELIGEDWELNFPVPDPQLAEIERRAVNDARAQAPRIAKSAARETYRVPSSRGPLQRDEIDEPSLASMMGAGGSAGGGPSLTPGSSGEKPSGATSSGANSAEKPGAEQRGSAHPSAQSVGSGTTPPTGAASQAGSPQPPSGEPTIPRDPHAMSVDPRAMSADPSRPKKRSLAETRGTNWGLLNAGPRSSAIVRTIRVQCRGDQLVFVSEGGDIAFKQVKLSHRTEDSIDEFVRTIQEVVKSWGIAGFGMHWRPLLLLEVGPSGEGRYVDLQDLLKDSGFDVKRK